MPTLEPGLSELVRVNAWAGQLSCTADLAAVVGAARVVLIAVGTPSRHGDGYADFSWVYGAARETEAALRGQAVVGTKSTVPVGTGDEVERIMCELRPCIDVRPPENRRFSILNRNAPRAHRLA